MMNSNKINTANPIRFSGNAFILKISAAVRKNDDDGPFSKNGSIAMNCPPSNS